MQITSSRRLINFLKANFLNLAPIALLFLLVSFISFKNYVPNAWLSGWDNLHPEFNFILNFQRSLNGAWQEYQGLGLVGGMAHASDLPRQLILAIFSAVIPDYFLRYLWTFVMLFVGSLGVFAITRSLAASIFYLLNLATIQYFQTSFDSFVGFYGFLPWLVFSITRYIEKGGRKNLLFLVMVLVLSTPAFYVQTFFVVFAVLAFIFGLIGAIRNGKEGLKRLFVAGFLTLMINSYWFLPVAYYTKNQASYLSVSHQNSIATPETAYFSQNRYSFEDISNLKGFWFDYKDFQDSKFTPVVSESDFKSNLYLFYIGLVGIILGIFIKKNSYRFSLPLVFLICFMMLSGYYRNLNIELVNEMFRSAFTKWSVAFSFVLALGISNFGKLNKYLGLLVSGVVISLSVFYAQPVFKNNLFYKNIKVEIPNDYFKLFDFLETKPNEARILSLPIYNQWGWEFHSWGYRGSGLIWYGIEQPIVHRSFDVWSPYNETFYNQISTALYTNNGESFKKNIEKYKVKYLLLDESVVVPGGDGKVLMLPETKELMAKLGYKEVFRSGFLAVYETDIETNKFINAVNRYSFINANILYSNFDSLYEKFGNYVQQEGADTYPFVNFDNRNPDIKISVDDSSNLILENPRFDSKVIIPLEKDQISKANFRLTREAVNCDIDKVGEVDKQIDTQGASYLASNGGVACDFLNFGNLAHNQGYLVRVKGKNLEGRSLKIYLQNWETLHMDLEELLPEGEFDRFFAVYPSISETKGYTVNLETRSFGKIPSKNTVELVEFYPVDFGLISTLVISGKVDSTGREENLSVLKIKKSGTAIYDVKTVGEGILQLEQGYEKGWIAFSLKGDKLEVLDHKLVNGWSNGWMITNADVKKVWIVFWPQFLEWGGMLLTILMVVVLTFKHKFYSKIPHNT